MDPITLATSYATIVGLICNFKQERQNRHDLDARAFIAWLDEQQREDREALKQFIIRSTELPSEIDKLLKQDTEMILSRLNAMYDTLASLPNRVDGLAKTIQATQSLSDRLRVLPILIDEKTKAVCKLERKGLFFHRSRAGGEWDIPMDVPSLKKAFEQLKSMKIEDAAHFSFVVRETAFETETESITASDRLSTMTILLETLEKLIDLREELDHLEEQTRTRRQ